MQNYTNKFALTFSSKQLRQHFPYFICIDSSGVVTNFGAKILKFYPDLHVNDLFKERFQIRKKGIIQTMQLECPDFLEAEHQIETKSDMQMQLSGCFYATNNSFVFLGMPDADLDLYKNENEISASNNQYFENKIIKSNEISSSRYSHKHQQSLQQFSDLVSDANLSLVASTNSNGVILTSLSGALTWVNNAYQTMTGCTYQEAIGTEFLDLVVSKRTDTTVLNFIQGAFATGKAFDYELYHKKKNNKSFWARLKGQPIFDEKGNLSQYFIIIEDTTEAKKISEQLINSEKRLSTLILNLQTGILLEDENRKIVLVNKTFCNMFGMDLNPSELIGFDCKDSAHQIKGLFKDQEVFLDRINEIVSNKEIGHHDELSLIDGKQYERQYVPILIEGNFKGNLWSYSDSTLKKNYEESLNYEKNKYRSIIDNMNIGLLEVSNADVILLANQQFCKMSGYCLNELVGKKGADMFLNEEGIQIIKNKTSKRKMGISDSYEITVKNAKGQKRIWLVSGAPNYNLNGEVIGSIGLHFDITNTKLLEEKQLVLVSKLENQNEQLLDYAQVVSHDLKSPLRSIHSLITFIKEDSLQQLDPKTIEYFNLIQEKTEKMDLLIQGILMYSKIENIDVISEEIDVNELIEDIKKTIYIPLNVTVQIKSTLPNIQQDRFKMQQLFQNLISNAVSYIDKPIGLVEITSKEKADHYLFSIKDNGIGIDQKNKDKIFEMFQTLNNSNLSTGIGLSIVRRIIKNSNEKIWLESIVGSETTFFFTIKK